MYSVGVAEQETQYVERKCKFVILAKESVSYAISKIIR